MQHEPKKARAAYIHNRTFFQHNRWSAHDLVGELLGRGIRQVSIALIDDDWTVSWVEPVPPDVIKDAEETPP